MTGLRAYLLPCGRVGVRENNLQAGSNAQLQDLQDLRRRGQALRGLPAAPTLPKVGRARRASALHALMLRRARVMPAQALWQGTRQPPTP